MLDPMKTQSAVLRFGTKVFKLASKRAAKLVAVLFWRKGFVDDLDLHIYREEGPLPLFHVARKCTPRRFFRDVTFFSPCHLLGENRRQRRKTIGVIGGDADSYHGTYKVLVQIKGQGSAYHLQQSKAVVAGKLETPFIHATRKRSAG